MAGKAAVLMTGRMELTEDTELAQRLLGNDQSGLEDILRAFGAGVLALLRRRFREVLREEDLEDVLSMGLFRLWNSRHRYDPARASLRVWWFRICENSARDVLRMGWQKARARETATDIALIGCVASSSGRASDQHCETTMESVTSAMQQDLRDVLSELPEIQRSILLADASTRDVVACSHRLGDEFSVPAATIRVYRKRAMDRVKREMLLRGHGGE